MADQFRYAPADAIMAPVTRPVAITAGSSEFDASRGVFCNVAGTFVMQFADDDSTVSMDLVAGSVYPFRIKKLTSGTGLFALY